MEAAKQSAQDLVRPDASLEYSLLPLMRDGRRNQMIKIPADKASPLQIRPIIVHLEQTGPIVVLPAAPLPPGPLSTPLASLSGPSTPCSPAAVLDARVQVLIQGPEAHPLPVVVLFQVGLERLWQAQLVDSVVRGVADDRRPAQLL